MSTLTASGVRTVAFGDLESGVWGAAWGAVEPFVTVGIIDFGSASAVPEMDIDSPAFGASTRIGGSAAFGASTGIDGSAAFGASTRIDGSAPNEDWRLSGPGIELTVSPAGEPATGPGAHDFDQLCRVQGRFVLGGAEHAVDSGGRRGSRAGLDLSELESIRDVSAWFDPGEGLALTALRPRGAEGHDRDQVSAAVFEPTGAVSVADPRLSTTYTADGLPVRVSLELWLDQDPDVEQYPRRAAGEALAARAASADGEPRSATDSEPNVQAQPLRCHSRGHEGAGVYLLVRPR